LLKQSVKIRRRGEFGDVAVYYAATSPNCPRRRILTDSFNNYNFS